jgi:glycosyltransferase involved in cell wall biosynthesis
VKALPTVSVVIPAYERAAVLPRALASVAAQTAAPLECIVVDDGSRDATATVARSHAGRVPGLCVLERANGGAGAARNAGLRRARGDLVAFLDSDDEWFPEHLARIARAAVDPDVDFLHGNHVHRDPSGDLDTGRAWDATLAEDRPSLYRTFAIKTSTVALRRACLEQLDEWFMEENRSCQDYEFFWRFLAVARSVRWLAEPTVATWVTEGSEIRRRSELDRLRDNFYARDRARRWLAQRHAAPELLHALAQGERADLAALLDATVLRRPFSPRDARAGFLESLRRAGPFWTLRRIGERLVEGRRARR